MRTQVAIIGAGPAGMFLAHLLREAGVEAVVLERRSRDYVEGRVRAGVLEPGTVALMRRLGLGARLDKEGLTHTGVRIAHEGALLRIDLAAASGGRTLTVYGQQAVMGDLFEAAAERGLPVMFEAEDVQPYDVGTGAPFVTWRVGGAARRLDCDFIVGCDGQHGVCKSVIPAGAATVFERAWPFGWMGVLAQAPPAAGEVVYARHDAGFALASMRSATISRYYLQCPLHDRVEDWPDERFWREVALRLGPAVTVTPGAALERSIAALRSLVVEPMRFGRLFLAGDAAHIVPPTGAKGLNLAASDAAMLAEAFAGHYRRGDASGLETYSARALARVWRAQRFSWRLTALTHRTVDATAMERRLQSAELDHLAASKAAQTAFAEDYLGLVPA